ncbi:hypothetical protein FOA52_014910 [Chlamydomonas sp. UWO 241]|nr:hypothetical protein FOA52_014910 [Chlamydomonas sp. UWO 241]
MDPHYFMGKTEILGWIENTLGLRLAKVEDTANGAVACQLLDAMHPGVVPMKKVDFNAKNEYDMLSNYKVLQSVFEKLNVPKHIEVAKLIKGRPLDNIEFMQWLKSYWDGSGGQVVNIEEYDGPGRRAHTKTGDMKGSVGSNANPRLSNMGQPQQAPARSSAVPHASRKTPVLSAVPRAGGGGAGGGGGGAGSSSGLAAELADARQTAEMLEKEKLFYYSKLRDIELLCQTPKINETPILKRVEQILYAPTAEEGRQILMDTQQEFAGQVFLEEEEAAAQEAAS